MAILRRWTVASLALLVCVMADAQSMSGVPMVMGTILWPDHDLTKAQVRFYRDPQMSDLFDVYAAGGGNGGFVAVLEPGQFYLMAIADLDGNDKLDPGDGIGYYGVARFDPATQRPRVLRVPQDGLVRDVQIPITATLNADSQPVPVEGEPAEVTTLPSGLQVLVSGTVAERFDHAGPVFVALLTADHGAPVAVARLEAGEADFELECAPGSYRLLALADVAEDGRFGPGDRLAAYGIADWAAAPTELPALDLDGTGDAPGLTLTLSGRLGAEGAITDAAGNGSARLDMAALPAVLCGTLRLPTEGAASAMVRISADAGMQELATVAAVDPDSGAFVALLAAGTYYLTALIDANDDGSFGPGDLVGFHGVTDLKAEVPQPIALGAAAIQPGVEITPAGQVAEDGGLIPITPQPNAEGTPQQ
jgi:uncharacterized protein (DUF2141 family)